MLCTKGTGEANQILQTHSDGFQHPNAATKQLNIANHHALCILQVQREAQWLKVTLKWLATFGEAYHACVSLQE